MASRRVPKMNKETWINGSKFEVDPDKLRESVKFKEFIKKCNEATKKD